MDDQRKTATTSLFSESERRAIYIILGMEGVQPETINDVAFQLFPDLASVSAPSRDTRVQWLRRILQKRVKLSSPYFNFYSKKRSGGKCHPKEYSPENIAFLEEVYRHCHSWNTLAQKIHDVLHKVQPLRNDARS